MTGSFPALRYKSLKLGGNERYDLRPLTVLVDTRSMGWFLFCAKMICVKSELEPCKNASSAKIFFPGLALWLQAVLGHCEDACQAGEEGLLP